MAQADRNIAGFINAIILLNNTMYHVFYVSNTALVSHADNQINTPRGVS